MSQEELGRKLDIGKSSVSEWESGKRALPIDAMELIAKVLNVSVPYLMGWDLCQYDGVSLESHFSSAALDLARRYDSLSEQSKQLISAIVLFESADVSVKNDIISQLIDHANERNQAASPFASASAAAALIIEEAESTPEAEAK